MLYFNYFYGLYIHGPLNCSSWIKGNMTYFIKAGPTHELLLTTFNTIIANSLK